MGSERAHLDIAKEFLPHKATSDYDREKLQERNAKLAGGVAKITVGGATEMEVKEKKMRFEDLVTAGVIDPTKGVRCALEDAASVATLLLTSAALIAEKPIKQTKQRGDNGDMY